MNKMRWIGLGIAAVLGLGRIGPALAGAPGGPAGVPFLNGGVGLDERQAMQALAGNYNLKLLFAGRQGEYLGEVRVSLRGPASLDMTDVGPWFWMRLPPGVYTVTATALGRAQTRTVTVGAATAPPVAFFW